MSALARSDFEQQTGALFEGLWGPYDAELFEASVALFHRRLKLAGFDSEFFKDKVCLDAGCGGGRNTIAMARLGAKEAHGIDIGAIGIHDARLRAQGLPNAFFQEASVEEIPFEDEKFDLVWCAGVLMHVENDERALDELTRVLKQGGQLYLLVYATGGMRWPLIQLLKPIAAQIGRDAMEVAVQKSGLPANKRRTFIDDLYCPKFDFYHWARLRRMLERRGFAKIDRWGPETRLDHEHSLQDYREDLQSLEALLSAGCDTAFGTAEPLFKRARDLTSGVIETIKWFEAEVEAGRLPQQAAMTKVIGQGHHRLFATKD